MKKKLYENGHVVSAIKKRDDFICQLAIKCNGINDFEYRSFHNKRLSIDHLIAQNEIINNNLEEVSYWFHNPFNLALSCQSCNSSKGAIIDWNETERIISYNYEPSRLLFYQEPSENIDIRFDVNFLREYKNKGRKSTPLIKTLLKYERLFLAEHLVDDKLIGIYGKSFASAVLGMGIPIPVAQRTVHLIEQRSNLPLFKEYGEINIEVDAFYFLQMCFSNL